MKTIADVLLLIAAFASVFFVAGLHNVPRSVRYSVLAIGPAFLFTFLLHLRFPSHVDFGLTAVTLAVTASAVFGFRYTNETSLSRDERFMLIKRFAFLFALSAVVVGVVASIILSVRPTVGRESPLGGPTQPPVSATITAADSTKRAIDAFNRLAK